jgi:hypothetical protein
MLNPKTGGGGFIGVFEVLTGFPFVVSLSWHLQLKKIMERRKIVTRKFTNDDGTVFDLM